MSQFFASRDEFALIEKLFPQHRFGRDGRTLGDDAFLFESPPCALQALTSDVSVEGTHFNLRWCTPEQALEKAILSNLSDINAMGGSARYALLNLGAKKQWDASVFQAMGLSIAKMEKEHRFQVSGGDTVRLAGNCFFSLAVLGEVVGNPLLRSHCLPGHKLYVSGTLGGSAAGLELLQKNVGMEILKSSAINAHLNPIPPLSLGPQLAKLLRPVGAIDISDGLSSELWHLARQSGCVICVEWSKLPMYPTLKRDWGNEEIHRFVLNGGEEYQLLFTGQFSETELSTLQAIAPITEIGRVESGEAMVYLEENHESKILLAAGFSHA